MQTEGLPLYIKNVSLQKLQSESVSLSMCVCVSVWKKNDPKKGMMRILPYSVSQLKPKTKSKKRQKTKIPKNKYFEFNAGNLISLLLRWAEVCVFDATNKNIILRVCVYIYDRYRFFCVWKDHIAAWNHNLFQPFMYLLINIFLHLMPMWPGKIHSIRILYAVSWYNIICIYLNKKRLFWALKLKLDECRNIWVWDEDEIDANDDE